MVWDIEIAAQAKLNLVLKVTGKRDGLHTLDTVIVPVNFADTIRLKRRDDGRINLRYTDRDGIYPSDTALRAAEAICSRYGLGGADVEIDKHIPEGAGMGGSSADAAGVAHGLELLYGYGKTDEDILSRIGSDVPAMYYGRPCRVIGTGSYYEPVEIKRNIYFAVVLGKTAVSTAEVYALYDSMGGEDGDINEALIALAEGEFFPTFNDLHPAAETLAPDIKDRMKKVCSVGLCAGMTGSGSAVFGYSYDREEFTRKTDALKKICAELYDILSIELRS